MLSGSWRRTGGAVPSPSLSSAGSRGRGIGGGFPGSSVVLEAQYDYSYRGADGRQVSIREGERFLLLRRTNADWWQARRIGAGVKAKPLYVPATYVVEVPITTMHSPQASYQSRASPHGNARLLPRASLQPCSQIQCSVPKPFCRSMEDLNSNSAFRGGGLGGGLGGGRFPALPLAGGPCPSAPSGSRHLMVPAGLQGSAGPLARSQSSSNLPQNPYEGGGRPRGRSTPTATPSKATPSKAYSQWDMGERSVLKARVPSGQQQVRRGQAEPPCPGLGQRPQQVLDLWDQHCDLVSGRSYYVNSVTKERSWKPPRRARERDRTLSQASAMQLGTFPRDTSHMSLPIQGTGNGTMHRLSPDFMYSTRDANSGRQLRQTMQRAVSSDALSSASFDKAGAQWCNSALQRGGEQLGHSHSMILPESSPNGKSPQQYSYRMTSVVVEPPTSASSPDSSDSTTTELEKAGLLNKTKIAEGGRKLRKSWNPAWVVLVGNSLVFFKDPKSQSPSSWKPGNSRPECSVDLRGAKLTWANDLSSKKNVFKLRTVTGNEFLLQSESDSVIKEWYITIQRVIDRLDRENPLDNVLLYSLRSAGSMELLDQSGDEDDGRGGYKASLPRSSSNLENSERKRVRSRLKQLILKRPPLQTLQEKGLIKDQVFGCRLEQLCEREKSTVPRFVKMCTEVVETRGLETDGIYRVSGNLAIIQKLRFAVNHERAVTTDGRYVFPEELVQEEKLCLEQWEDVHVVTGALKLFFRELPEPLVPYGFFSDVMETVKMSDYLDKVDRLKYLVFSMPPPNHDTMRFIFRHLKRVMEHADSNRMSTQNIGIVFGPTLMRAEYDNGNMAINMVYQNLAVELILSEFHNIFGPDPPGSL